MIQDQTLNALGQDYFKSGFYLVGNISYANYLTDGVDDQFQLQVAIDQVVANLASNTASGGNNLPTEIRVVTNLSVNANASYTETVGGDSRRIAVRLRDGVKITIASGVTISFGSGGNSGFNGGTVFTSVFGNYGNLSGASVVCEGQNAFDGLSSTAGTATDRHSAVWLDARSNSCSVLKDINLAISGKRTAGALVRTYNSNTGGTTIAKNITTNIINADACFNALLAERNGEAINSTITNCASSLADGVVYKDGVENSIITIKRVISSTNNGLKVFIDTAVSTKFNNLQIREGNIESSGDHNIYIAGMDGQIQASVWGASKGGIYFDEVTLTGTNYYPKKITVANTTANNNNQSASTWAGIGGIVKNVELIGFEASDTQGSPTQYRGIDFTNAKCDNISLVSGKSENNTNTQISVVGVNSSVGRGVVGFNRVYTVSGGVTYTIAGPEDCYVLGNLSVLKFPKFSKFNTNGQPSYQVTCTTGSSEIQAEQEDDLSYKEIDTQPSGSAYPVLINQSFSFLKYSDKWRATVNVTSTTSTLTNVTLSTGVKLDAKADENLSLHSMARQAIDNGNFDIWQRNTTVTNPAVNSLIADRWALEFSSTGTLPGSIIHSRQSPTPGEFLKSKYIYRIAPNGAGSGFGANDFYALKQTILGGVAALCGSGKKITVSFRAKSSIINKKIGVYIVQNYGSGGNPSNQEILTGTNFTLTSSEALYSYTFTTNTLSGKIFGTTNNDRLVVYLVEMWGTGTTAGYVGSTGVAQNFGGSGNIDIGQVQLCAGDVALPFQPKKVTDELGECKKYYQKSFNTDVVPVQNIGSAATASHFKQTSGGAVSAYAIAALDTAIDYRVRSGSTVTVYNPAAFDGNIRNFTRGNSTVPTPVAEITNQRTLAWSFTTTAGSASQDDYFWHWAIDTGI
jgi:hypothetical protein